MVATFCLSSSASRRDVRTSAWSDTPSATTIQTARCTSLFYRVSLRSGTVRLPRARDELQHALLHHFLEHTESRLLANVEDLIDRVVRLAYLGLRPVLEILQRLDAFPGRRLVELCLVGELPQ